MPLERLITERLELLALSCDELKELSGRRETKPQLAENLFSLNAERAIHSKLKKMTPADLKNHVWFTYWLLTVRASGLGVGLAGFKGPPNENGEVDIGYGLAPDYEGQGYGALACQAGIHAKRLHRDCGEHG